ncbi:MAG: Ig-like domain-containing protein, partial [Gemmatimonadaceae bacterium]|nr:Ig-like domain-containing protein [Gemmatimonadaceae bacterium]
MTGRSSDRRTRWPLVVAYAALLVSCESPFAPDVVRPARVEITPNVLKLVTGGTATLAARVYDDSDVLLPAASVFWSSQDPSVVTVDQAGFASAVAAGTAQIAASSGGVSHTIAVTVEERPIALIRVTPSAGSVIAGQTLPLLGEALDAMGNVLPNRPLLWESSHPALATVSTAGVVTGLAVGVVTITATGEGKTGTSVISVLPAPVASITVTPDGGSLTVGTTLTLTATPRDALGQPLADRTLSWQSDNPAVASVSSDGLVTAVSPGTASITVSAPGGGPNGTTPTRTVLVTVLLAPVGSAVIVPSPATVQVGQVVNFTVNLFSAAGAPLSPAGRTISWTTSHPSIATVSNAGVATGLAIGVATLTMAVTTPGQAAPVQVSVQLTVVNQPVVSVQVAP